METVLRLWFCNLMSFYFSVTAAVIGRVLPKTHRFPILIPIFDSILSLYFRFCNLCPCTVDLDDQTTVHFWAPTHRRFSKPNLVIIHGYGGNAKWQFALQVRQLAESFNLYVPDLLFFGESHSRRPDRTVAFQAECVAEGLKGLGVRRSSVYGISYGGFVAYRMAEVYPDAVERVVIVNSGIASTADQRAEQMVRLKKMGRENAVDVFLPAKPDDLRLLVNQSFSKCDPLKWVPDFILREVITVMYTPNRKEREELLDYLLTNKDHSTHRPRRISQEALLVWGESDKIFPLEFGQLLQRYLGANKARLEVIEGAGHAVNLESASSLNSFIKTFLLHSDSPCREANYINLA